MTRRTCELCPRRPPAGLPTEDGADPALEFDRLHLLLAERSRDLAEAKADAETLRAQVAELQASSAIRGPRRHSIGRPPPPSLSGAIRRRRLIRRVVRRGEVR